MFLDDLACESSLIFQDTSGQVYNFGSSAGYSFLCLNPDINIKFRDHFSLYSFLLISNIVNIVLIFFMTCILYKQKHDFMILLLMKCN